MKEIKAIKEFSYKNKIYSKGDVLNISNIKDLVILNEHGFIEPLNAKDLQDYNEYLNNKNKKEVVKYGTTI